MNENKEINDTKNKAVRNYINDYDEDNNNTSNIDKNNNNNENNNNIQRSRNGK